MSNIATSTTSHIPAPVADKLRALRVWIRLWFLVDGLGRVVTALVVLAAGDLLLDWYFRMDRAQRGVMLVLMTVALAVIFYRRLVRPLSCSLRDDALCLQVEEQHKELGQSLVSAMQFSRMVDVEQRGVSPSLLRAAIDQGTRAAQQIDFTRTLDVAKFRRNAALLIIATALVAAGCVGVANTPLLAVWFNRNVMLGDMVWPQQTYLLVKRVTSDNRVVLPRGESWTQLVDVTPDSKVVPDAVYVEFRPSRSRPSQKLRKSGRQFDIVFQNVIEEFQFRARGGDAMTPWISVELVDQPAVRELTLDVTPPKYTGGKTEPLPAGKGPYYVLKGSTLQLSGLANKPLAEATLLIDDRPHPLAIIDSTHFAATLSAKQFVPGQYVIHLRDTAGLESKRPTSFGIQLRPDREPQIRARLIGISGMVVAKARIPFTSRITDDFAVSDIRLSYQWRGDDAEAGAQSGVSRFDQAASLLGREEFTLDDAFDLQPLNIPSSSGLTFRLEADDNDDESGPNTGRSPEFLVRVVTDEQFRADLLRREKEQRQEFERLLKNQEDLLTECRALAATARGQSPLADEHKQTLMTIQRRQKLAGTNTATIATRLDEYLIEVHNNRLEQSGGPLHRRLSDQIIRPMQQVADDGVPEAVQRLDKARRLQDTAADRDPALDEAVAQQQAIANAMRDILSHMVKAEGYQEAVNLLYEIEKLQKEVYERTVKEKQEQIKRILEGGGASSPNKPSEDGK
jgi:hypothetical protein